MPKPDHRSQMAWAWLHFHAARKGRGSGSAAPRVDWPVYPRRAEHNTVAEGGNRRWAETAPAGLPPRSDARSGLSVTPAARSGELADDPAHRVRDAQQDRKRRAYRRQHDGRRTQKPGNLRAVPAPVRRQGLLSQPAGDEVRRKGCPRALRATQIGPRFALCASQSPLAGVGPGNDRRQRAAQASLVAIPATEA